MSSLRRVRNLETLARRIRPPADSHQYDEDEWLVLFEQYYESGHAANEPDYPLALDGYRAALAEAYRQGFDRPATFRPEDADRRSRTRAWRTREPSRRRSPGCSPARANGAPGSL